MFSFLMSVAPTIPRASIATAASATPIEFSLSSSSSTISQPLAFPFCSRSSPALRLGYARSFARSSQVLSSISKIRDTLIFLQGNPVMPELLTEFAVDMKKEECVKAVESKLEIVEGLCIDFGGIKNVDNQGMSIFGSSPVKDMNQATEQTGPKACLVGQGVPQVPAAVSEFKGPKIFGVVRFIQISTQLVRIEASFGGLSPGKHSWCINEYGDLTKGAASTGKIYNPLQEYQTATQLPGDLGTLVADESGEAFYTVKKEKIKVMDLIGRAVVVYETQDMSLQGITAAVVARSAGSVGENYNKLCSCDGTTIWESTIY